ncbi:hypothetical protein B0H14DRAFT_2589268 [Mycena olivaceomarginata]|nr:hypothetical protein B0H14DRAFT_2589268 [Mycena olivaceomarginata]
MCVDFRLRVNDCLHKTQDTWIPVIKECFCLSSASSSDIQFRSAWVIERPNHGEPALVNPEPLKKHYSAQFPSLQYATAIHTFLTSSFLSVPERNNLVTIGHSGAVIHFCNHFDMPFVGPEGWPLFRELYDRVEKSNAHRPTHWPSKGIAMKWFTMSVTAHVSGCSDFRRIHISFQIPSESLSTKTTVEQETHLQANIISLTILNVLPTHVILGSINDLMPPVLSDLIARNTRQVRPQLTSLTVIEDCGYYLPAVKL